MRTYSILTYLLVTPVTALICLVARNGYSQETDPKATVYFEKGMQASPAEKRVDFFEKALAIEPNFPDALYQLGLIYLEQGAFEESVDFLTRIASADTAAYPDFKSYLRDAYSGLAANYLTEDESSQALYAAREALYLDETYPPALATLGKVYLKRHELPAALEALETSLERDPNQASAWNSLGDVYLRMDHYPAAIQAYEQALALAPNLKSASFHVRIARKRNSPEAWLKDAEYFIQQDSLLQAITVLQRAVQAHPEDTALQRHLAGVVQEQTYRDAIRAFQSQEWTKAADLLQQVNPEYKDAFLKLEEARAELILTASDSLLPDIDVTDTEPPVAAENNSSPPDSAAGNSDESKPVETAAPVDPFSETEAPIGATIVDQAAVADSQTGVLLAAKNLTPTNGHITSEPLETPPEVPVKQIAVQKTSFWNATWITAAAGSVLLLALVIVQVGRMKARASKSGEEKAASHQQSNLSVQTEKQIAAMSTAEIFERDIASETLVTFNAINTHDLLNPESPPASTLLPEDSLLARQETRTIFAGPRKMDKIGRYVVEKQIGRGSMGLILKAWDPKLDRTVVIKQIVLQLCKDGYAISRLRDRLYREARAAGKLNHPNIITIYDVEELDSSSYIVMEYWRGHDLREITQTRRPLATAQACRILQQICDALEFAHSHGIVHRDIKPANLLLAPGDRVKVADFGIAKLAQHDTLTRTGDMLGTPFYMSPEQIEGRRVDGRCDIFSAGVVLYELLTGQRPFGGDSIPAIVYNIVHTKPQAPSKVNVRLGTEFDTILERALAKDPGDRYKTATEFRQAIEQAERGVSEDDV